MTPKEKANELSFKLYDNTEPPYRKATFEQSRMCALICADEIINAMEFNSSSTAEGLTKYYEDVKQEINKL